MDNLTDKGEEWGRIGDESPDCSPDLLLEYGQLILLHQGGGVNAVPLVWGRSRFTSADAVFGIAFDWVKELIAGEQFVFFFRFDALPDLILADGKVVWRRTRDFASGGKTIVPYVPQQSGPVRLAFIKDRRYRAPEYAADAIHTANLAGCRHMGKAEHTVDYEKYDLLNTLIETRPEAVLTNRDYFTAPLEEPNMKPLPAVDYPTMKLDILHELVEAYLPQAAYYITMPTPEQIRHQIDLIPLLEAAGISGMHLYHLTDELLEALANSKLRAFIVPTCSAGEWWGPCGGESHITRPAYEKGLTLCNRLLDRIDNCHVYIWFPEIEDRENDLFKSPKWKARMNQPNVGVGALPYNDMTDNEFWKEEEVRKANLDWKRELLEKINDPVRVTCIYQHSNPFAPAHSAAAGADMTVNKNIFRGCFNVTVAAGRGTKKTHHHPHGFDFDPWSWRFRMNYHPLEWRQGLMVYLHAGADFLFHEGTLFRRDVDGRVKPNAAGVEFCHAARYARRHPAIGSPVVKIAAMHGSGEYHHCLLPRFWPQIPNDLHSADWCELRYRDWRLLDVFFPGTVGETRGNLSRLMTGTPYGPLDVIPWDTAVDDLQGYDFVFMPGSNGCDHAQLENLTNYVRCGGTLVMALGQLAGKSLEPRRPLQSDFTELAGISVTPDTWNVTVHDAEVLHRFPEGSQLLRHRWGKGQTYLFTTSTLTTLGEEQPRKLLEQLGRNSSFVSFTPFSDWLEVMVSRKGETVGLSLFNHGQIGFPSGNGPKTPVWQGRITLDLAKLDLPSNVEVKTVIDGCRLDAVAAEIAEGKLNVDVEIDCFRELVIGPAERLESDWYGR